ncbi:MAG: gtaB 3 [Acidimicrobiaceae bacterium]|nr:gtaB 3 [Acidimicrobiaceae bacterium]
MTRIRTAIIPAVALGTRAPLATEDETRALPATEAVPQELLPVRGRPVLDWVLDEAAIAGIEQVILVSSEHKSIEAYLSANRGGPRFPSERQRALLGLTSAEPSRPLRVHFMPQPELSGLSDAVLRGWHAVGGEPVAVLLPSELMLGGAELLASMLEHHDRQARSIVAIAPFSLTEAGVRGWVELSNPGADPAVSVTRCAEKPMSETASSGFAICGRYLLELDVLRALETVKPAQRDDVRFITALNTAARSNDLLGVEVLPRDGRIHIGEWSGLSEAKQRAFDSTGDAEEEPLLQVTNHTGHSRASMVA